MVVWNILSSLKKCYSSVSDRGTVANSWGITLAAMRPRRCLLSRARRNWRAISCVVHACSSGARLLKHVPFLSRCTWNNRMLPRYILCAEMQTWVWNAGLIAEIGDFMRNTNVTEERRGGRHHPLQPDATGERRVGRHLAVWFCWLKLRGHNIKTKSENKY